MPTMKASLQFKDEKGEHGGRAASGVSGSTRQQPGDAKKPERKKERMSGSLLPARVRRLPAESRRPPIASGRRRRASEPPKKTLPTSGPQIWG